MTRPPIVRCAAQVVELSLTLTLALTLTLTLTGGREAYAREPH